MRTILGLLITLAFCLGFAQESQAQRRFLFPNIAAARLNAQARANGAAINANVAVAAARGQAIVFAAPRHHNNNLVFQAVPSYARNNVVFFAQPVQRHYQQQVIQQVPIYQQQQVPIYQQQQVPIYQQQQVVYAPPVFNYVQAMPAYAPQVFQAAPAYSSYSAAYSTSFASNSICGF